MEASLTDGNSRDQSGGLADAVGCVRLASAGRGRDGISPEAFCPAGVLAPGT